MKSSSGHPASKESDRKKLELGDAMEHEHGQEREETEEDIEDLGSGEKGNHKTSRR